MAWRYTKLELDLKDNAHKIICKCRGRDTQVGAISCGRGETKGELIELRKRWVQRIGLCEWSGTGVQEGRKLAEADHNKKNKLPCETPTLQNRPNPNNGCDNGNYLLCFNIHCKNGYILLTSILVLPSHDWQGSHWEHCRTASSETEVDLITLPGFVNLDVKVMKHIYI